MKINEVLIEPFEFHSAVIESNDDLIEYAQIIASDMLQYGLATSDRDWRHIFRHLVRESINDQITPPPHWLLSPSSSHSLVLLPPFVCAWNWATSNQNKEDHQTSDLRLCFL